MLVLPAIVLRLKIVGRIWKNQKHKNWHKILKKCDKQLKIGQMVYFNVYELLLKYKWQISNFDPFLTFFVIFEKFEFSSTSHFGIFFHSNRLCQEIHFCFIIFKMQLSPATEKISAIQKVFE